MEKETMMTDAELQDSLLRIHERINQLEKDSMSFATHRALDVQLPDYDNAADTHRVTRREFDETLIKVLGLRYQTARMAIRRD